MEPNQRVFNRAGTVHRYGSRKDLFPAEAAIAKLLEPQWTSMRMLDLGVGGGRTTWHFAPRVREYVGVDYAEAQVNHCRKTFASEPFRTDFYAGDARTLTRLGLGRFDFILFSFNGIDFVDAEGRQAILDNVRDSLNPGGGFAFSCHNIRSAGNFGPSSGPFFETSKIRRWAMEALFGLLNGSARRLRQREQCRVRDGGQAFRIRNFFIRPEAQAEVLRKMGFQNIRVFDLEGNELSLDPEAWPQRVQSWYYFLCDI